MTLSVYTLQVKRSRPHPQPLKVALFRVTRAIIGHFSHWSELRETNICEARITKVDVNSLFLD